MLGDDQQRRGRHEKKSKRLAGKWAEDPGDEREQRDGDDRGKRDGAKREKHRDEDANHDENRFGHEHKKRTETGRDAFATPKLQPDRKAVADDGEQRSDCQKNRTAGKEAARDDDGGEALRGVEQKREHAERRRFAGDVGGADVAAAALADVLATKDADEQVAKGDGAENVADGDGDEQRTQRHWSVMLTRIVQSWCNAIRPA